MVLIPSKQREDVQVRQCVESSQRSVVLVVLFLG